MKRAGAWKVSVGGATRSCSLMCPPSSRAVGDSPARLLADTLLGAREELQKRRKRSRGNDNLGLEVVSGDNVADRAEGRGLNRRRLVVEEVDEPAADTRFNDGLDLVVGAVGEVLEGGGQEPRVSCQKKKREQGGHVKG